MKKIFYILSIAAIAGLFACNQSNTKHTHEDGVEHEGESSHDTTATPTQETFVVDSAEAVHHSDSSAHAHDHEHGHSHKH